MYFSDSFVLYSCSCHVLLAEFRILANLTGFHVFTLMQVFAQIFFFRTGGGAFSQKIERSVSIFFSDSFVVYSCSCHVLLAEAPLSEGDSKCRNDGTAESRNHGTAENDPKS